MALAALFLGQQMVAHAQGQPDPLQGYFGNTLEMHSQGDKISVYINDDGSWDGIFMGRYHAGKSWSIDGARVCFFNSDRKGAAASTPSCFDGLLDRQLADQWILVKIGEQREWKASLVSGRQVLP